MPRDPHNVVVEIPTDLLEEFKVQPRIVIRDHLLHGIPVPDALLAKDFAKRITAAGFEVMLVPKQML